MTKTIPAALALLVLGACHGQPAAPEATETAQATQAAVQVSDARLVLPAVPGHPAAAYFTIANLSGQPATITAIAIDGAGKAEMHVTEGGAMQPLPRLDLGAGQTSQFGPGGKHVMVFDLAPKLVAGGSTTITFTLADGRKTTAQAAIQGAGAAPAMDHMTMDHMKM